MAAQPGVAPDTIVYVRVTDFTGGEISPLFEGRVDEQKYFSSCRQMRNFLPLAQGGATRRPGTVVVTTLPFGTDGPDQISQGAGQSGRLMPYIYTEDSAYVVLWQGQNNDESPAIYFATNDGIVTSGGAPYSIASPYDQPSLNRLMWAQLNAVVWLVDGSLPPNFLSNYNPTSWTIDDTSFLPGPGPFMDVNPTLGAAAPTTLTAGAATGSTTLTASATAGINNGAGFLATDVGRQVRMLLPDPLADGFDPATSPDPVWGQFYITGYTSSTVVTGTAYLRPAYPTDLSSSQWQLGAFGTTTGYPATVTFWQGRVWYANTASQPNTVWGSYSGNFVDFAGTRRDNTLTDADAVSFSLADAQADGVRWIRGVGAAQQAQLGLGTRADEHVLQAASGIGAISAGNVQGYRESSYGSRFNAMPTTIGKAALFPRLFGKKLNEYAWQWQAQGYLATDLLRLAEHLAGPGGLKRQAWQQEPSWILWFTTDDFRLLSLTYLKEENVFAWAQHPLGGNWNGGPVLISDLAVIPNTVLGQDELWLTVTRTIGGGEITTLEVLQPLFRGDRRQNPLGLDGAWFVDGGIRSALVYPQGGIEIDGLLDRRPLDRQGRPYGPPRWGQPGDVFTVECSHASFVNALDTGAGAAGGKPGGGANPATVATVKVQGAILRVNGGKAIVTGFVNSTTLTCEVLVPFLNTASAGYAGYYTPTNTGTWSLTPRWTRFTGLDLYDGETVSLFGDGSDCGDQVVNGGAVTVPAPGVSLLLAGLPLRADLETIELEAEGGPFQVAMGKVQRVHQLYARLYETVGGWFGPDEGTLDPWPIRSFGDPAGLAPPLFTGNRRVPFPGGADRKATVHLMQDRPLPMTCLALVAALEPTE